MFRSFYPSTHFFTGLPKLAQCLALSLKHLFQSAAGWSLSEDSYARLLVLEHSRLSLIVPVV